MSILYNRSFSIHISSFSRIPGTYVKLSRTDELSLQVSPHVVSKISKMVSRETSTSCLPFLSVHSTNSELRIRLSAFDSLSIEVNPNLSELQSTNDINRKKRRLDQILLPRIRVSFTVRFVLIFSIAIRDVTSFNNSESSSMVKRKEIRSLSILNVVLHSYLNIDIVESLV